jgi:hypothetical protein
MLGMVTMAVSDETVPAEVEVLAGGAMQEICVIEFYVRLLVTKSSYWEKSHIVPTLDTAIAGANASAAIHVGA